MRGVVKTPRLSFLLPMCLARGYLTMLTDREIKATLEELTAAGKVWGAATYWIGVCTAITNRGSLTTLADVTEAFGAMSTRQAPSAWGNASRMVDGRWYKLGTPVTFSPSSPDEGQMLVGYIVATLPVGGELRRFELLPEAISLPDENHDITIIPRVTIDPQGRWHADVIIDG